MERMSLSHSDLAVMEDRQRARLINSLSGFKSANLIGTCDSNGQENLAIVSSVIHLGSNPPLLGFINRPNTVERHTLENILSTGAFTINAISEDIAAQAHQTSARYPKNRSEFDEVELTPYYAPDFAAPFVAQSPLQIGLRLIEHISIQSNGTEMIIGEIVCLSTQQQAIMPDGLLDIEALNIVTLSGLDSYHTTQRLFRLSYAKPNTPVKQLNRAGESVKN